MATSARQDDSHPQLVINQNDGGQVTVAWDDFGSGATASPPFDILDSSLVQPGDSFGFTGGTGPITSRSHQRDDRRPHRCTTSFNDTVSVPLTQIGSLDNLTVTVDLIDQESVQNLNLTWSLPTARFRSRWLTTRTMPPARPTPAWAFPAATRSGCSVSPRAPPDPRDQRRHDLRRQRHPEHLRPDDHRDQREYARRTISATSGRKFGSLKSFLASLGGDVNGTGRWWSRISPPRSPPASPTKVSSRSSASSSARG